MREERGRGSFSDGDGGEVCGEEEISGRRV